MNSRMLRPRPSFPRHELGGSLTRWRLFAIVMFAALVALSAGSATAISPYEITDLGTLGGTMSHAFAVNIHGDVVGSSTIASGFEHAFLYQNGTMTDLGVLSGDSTSVAFGINDSGLVVGRSQGATSRAFYSNGGPLQFLGSLGGTYGFATAVNNVGQIVGISADANGATHAFRYTSGGMSDLGTFPGGDYSIAYGINSSGDVTGYSTTNTSGHSDAFLYSGGNLQILGDLGFDSRGFKINDAGYVVGDAIIDGAGNERVLLWHGGTYANLGITAGAVSADGGNVNNYNQVVGTLIFDLADGTKNHGFLFSDGVMVDVNSMLPAGSGWHLRDAQAINDRGQIVGFGNIGGEQHAYLLTPVPEPSTFVIFGFSVLTMFAIAESINRRRARAQLSLEQHP